MTDLLHLKHFQSRIGEAFDLLLDDGSRYPLILRSATALKAHEYPGRAREPFDLLFTGTADMLRQRTWPVENAAMGRLDLFLVPIRREDGKAIYQAVFT